MNWRSTSRTPDARVAAFKRGGTMEQRGLGGGGGKYPIYISYMDFCKNFIQDGTGANTERAVTKISDTSLTVADTTRLAADIPVAIKTINNNYLFNIVESVVSTTITLKTAITEDFSTIQDIQNASTDAMHLSDLGYRAIGQVVAEKTKKGALRYNNKLDGSVSYGKLNVQSDPRVYYASDSSLFLNFQYLPGSVYGTPASNYAFWINEDYYLVQSQIKGYGVSLNLGNLKSGAFVQFSGYVTINSGYYGEFLIELVNSSNVVVDSAIINRSSYYSSKYLYTNAQDSYTLKIKCNQDSANFNILRVSNIQVFDNTGSTGSILTANSRIALFGDSWLQRITGTSKLRPDGSSLGGVGTIGATISEKIPGITTYYCGLAGSTSEWGRYWIDYIIGLKPTHVLLHFGINDYNSRNNYPSTSSGYDFDPANKWAFKTAASGGVIGSVSKARYVDNMKFMIKKCIDNNITPIILSDTPIAGYLTNARLWQHLIYNGIYE